jgi:hypothetical protein
MFAGEQAAGEWVVDDGGQGGDGGVFGVFVVEAGGDDVVDLLGDHRVGITRSAAW